LLLLEVQNCHNSELSKCLYLKVKWDKKISHDLSRWGRG